MFNIIMWLVVGIGLLFALAMLFLIIYCVLEWLYKTLKDGGEIHYSFYLDKTVFTVAMLIATVGSLFWYFHEGITDVSVYVFVYAFTLFVTLCCSFTKL